MVISNLLEIEDLNIRFVSDQETVKAVRDVSLTLKPGEVLGIVGESGAGKSTIGNAIVNLLDDSGEIVKGKVIFEDQNLVGLDDKAMRSIRGKKIGMIFQDPQTSLNPIMTIGNQLIETFRFTKNFDDATDYKEAEQLLTSVGIDNPQLRMKAYPHQFSGGMRQRVVIALSLAGDPDLIIADEPTTALDVTVQAQIMDLLKEIKTEIGAAIILITHDLGVIAQVADHVAVMYLGSVVEKGPVNEILKNPKHPYTKGLLQALPDINNLDAPLSPIPGNIPSPLDRPTGCVFRTRCPHHNPEGKDGKIEMKLIEVEPGHWVDQCGIKCGQNG